MIGRLLKAISIRLEKAPAPLSTEQVVREEVDHIEGRTLPGPHRPWEPQPSPPGEAVRRAPGKLAQEVRRVMDGPRPPLPGAGRDGRPVIHDGTHTANHSPPGAGAGMVDNGAVSPLFALCLSGGGIRSAAFCLGAVQSLAQDGLLARFHYLSTVSGGGYTGSVIARLIRTMGGVAPAERVLADPQCAPAVGWLETLREYTSFLAPRLGAASLDVWAAVVLYVRNTLANWLLFLPGLTAAALAPRLYLRLVEMAAGGGSGDRAGAWGLGVAGCICLFWAAVGACLLVPGHQPENARPHVTAAVVVPRITVPLALGWAFLATLWIAARGPLVSPYVVPAAGAAMSLLAYLAAWAYTRGCGLAASAPIFGYNLLGWIVATVADTGVLLAGILLVGHFQYQPLLLAVLGPAWMVLSHLVHAACYAVLRREVSSSWMEREWIARLSATHVLSVLVWTLLAAVCLVLLHRLHWLLRDPNPALVLPALLTGPIAAWLGRSTLTVAETALSRVSKLRMLPNLIAAVASIVFLATLLMLASAAGWRVAARLDGWFTGCSGELAWALPGCAPGLCTSGLCAPALCTSGLCAPALCTPDRCAPGFGALLLVAAVLGVVSLVVGQWLNINRYSLHELYRNRLVRAFLGSGRPTAARKADGFAQFDEGDALRLSDALPYYPTVATRTGVRLFPVVNTTLNLVSGTRTAWAERKAASFTMTPLHCGSAILTKAGAYQRSTVYGGTRFVVPPGAETPGIQLGTAMTISGAAVSPNMGYLSSATTSFIMTLFNARLGAWLPNPATARKWAMRTSRPGNSFLALVSEMLGLTDAARKAIFLSDGGHFENLGIYEMLRRRCRLIVAFDAGCDPDYAYFDLGSALRKARIDLGVEVTFAPGVGPVPGTAPGGLLRADIAYPAGPAMRATSGVLLYVKSHLPASAPADVLAFKAADAAFPHDTTGNQFFTESQFESYRRLGEHVAS